MSTGCLDSKTLTTLSSGQRRLSLSNQRFLPVAKDGKLVGAITRTDLLRVLEDEITGAACGKAGIPRNLSEEKKCRGNLWKNVSKKTH